MSARPSALWRRNLIGAVVFAMCLAVWTAWQLWPNWTEYRHATTPEHVVGPRESRTVDGVTWRLDRVRHLGAAPKFAIGTLPKGTVLTIVSIERTGAGPTNPMCDGVLTDGTHRWSAEPFGGYSQLVPEGTSTNCVRPGPVQFMFAVPQDAVPTALDVVVERSIITLRLQL